MHLFVHIYCSDSFQNSFSNYKKTHNFEELQNESNKDDNIYKNEAKYIKTDIEHGGRSMTAHSHIILFQTLMYIRRL